MNPPFIVRAEPAALVLSFPAPSRALSWAVLNGSFCHADHVINHHVSGDDRSFSAQPARWLERATLELGLRGKVVAMATAVDMKNLVRISMCRDGAGVTCFATVGCGNALSVGDPATAEATESARTPLHTINLILTVQSGLSDEAMVEAIQIATEGRVRALHEVGIRSSLSGLAATGTGTDCIAVVALGTDRAPYCGKHTQLGELIGLAAYTAVKNGLAQGSPTNGPAPGGESNDDR